MKKIVKIVRWTVVIAGLTFFALFFISLFMLGVDSMNAGL